MNETTTEIRPCCAPGCLEPGLSVGYAPFLSLCRAHLGAHHVGMERKYRHEFLYRVGAAEDLAEKYPTDGFTYVIYLPNGNVKIGYVGGEYNARGESYLVNRWAALTTELGFKDVGGRNPREGSHSAWYLPHPVAVLDGGESLEAQLHIKWDHLRVPVLGEQLYATPELIEWAQGLGFCERSKPHVNGPMRDGVRKSSYAEWVGHQTTVLAKKYGSEEKAVQAVRAQQLAA